jgi:hypothetical protein
MYHARRKKYKFLQIQINTKIIVSMHVQITKQYNECQYVKSGSKQYDENDTSSGT